jgi:hypothetical protein
MALPQLSISLDSLWLGHLIVGRPFLFVFGFAAMCVRRVQHFEERFLPGRSLYSRVMSPVNPGTVEYRGHLRE